MTEMATHFPPTTMPRGVSPATPVAGRPSEGKSFLHKYFRVLTGQRGRMSRLLVLFVGFSLFDTLTISLIGPFVGALLNPALLQKIPAFGIVFGWFGLVTVRDQLLAMGATLAVLSILKGVGAFAVQWRVLGFAFRFRAHLVKKLMRAYLVMPYRHYLERNSSAFVQSVTAHTKVMADDLLIPSLRLVADGTMVTMLGLFLLYVSPPATLLLVLMVGGALIAYIRLVRPIVRTAGGDVAVTHERIIRGVNEGIGGIKEIRVLRAEDNFFASIAAAADINAGAQQVFNALLVLPKYLMEAVIVLFVILFSTFVIVQGANGEALIATLAMFAAAGMRILPAISQVSASLASMNYCRYVLDEVYDDLDLIDSFAPPAIAAAATDNKDSVRFELLELSGVGYRYSGAARPAIADIDLKLERGGSIGLIGKSGAGKTTLVDILLGLHPFDAGAMRVNGQDIADYGWNNWVDQVAYIPQNVFLIDDSIARNVAFGVPEDAIDRARINRALAQAQLTELVAGIPHGLDTRLGERGVRLSGGERQRIGLARAFYMDRQVLILDEATSALDAETERHITEVIRSVRGERTLIVIAHRLTTVRDCERIYRLAGGGIVAHGTYEEVIGE